MKRSISLTLGSLLIALTLSGAETDRQWENPHFDTEAAAVEAAVAELPALNASSSHALKMFIACTLGDYDRESDITKPKPIRETINNFLLTRPVTSDHDDTQRRTITRFRDAMRPQQRIITGRLARFGFPDLDGLVWCKMVENVDAFAGLMPASSDKMSRVGGVTYYCRYIMLPLSYISTENIRELRRSAGLNPSIDINDTLHRWQRESFANLVSTFRHELVHVHTNSGLGVPFYSDRSALPTWFHEGTATYLSGDPHAGLSTRYQEYQKLFFYLVQRHGVAKLVSFYRSIFEGQDTGVVLENIYNIEGSQQLFASAARWHRLTGALRTGFWIVGLVIVVTAFRSKNLPVLGALQILIALALATSLGFGLAEHLQGLNGSTAVLLAKVVTTLVVILLGGAGLVRISRHFRVKS